MSDVSRNYIDLMYLTNPSNISRIKRMNEVITVDIEDQKKYKKEVIKITDRLINGEKISVDINELFNNYFKKIKEHLEFTKKKNLVQSQYHLMKEKEKKEYIKMDLSGLDITMMKKPDSKKIKNLNDFIKKKKKKKKGMVMPQKIVFD